MWGFRQGSGPFLAINPVANQLIQGRNATLAMAATVRLDDHDNAMTRQHRLSPVL
jgi:hypothetical protein